MNRFIVFALVPTLVAAVVLAFAAPALAINFDRNDAIAIATTGVIDTLSSKAIALGYAPQTIQVPGESIYDEDAYLIAVVADSSWFIWIDELPMADFAHPTRYVLVDAITGSITLNSGGGFYPTVGGTDRYRTDADRAGPDLFYTGPSAPKPTVGEPGQGFEPLGLPRRLRPLAFEDGDKWALLVSAEDTSAVQRRAADLDRAKQVYRALGVPDSNMVIYNGPTKAGLQAGIDSLAKGCDKVYVYWTGHGRGDSLFVPGPDLTGKEFACLIDSLDADDYCVWFGTCHSDAFFDDLFAKGINGFHMAAADSGRVRWTWDPGQSGFTGGWFEYFYLQCFNTGLRGFEAFVWADSVSRAYLDSLNAANPGWGGLPQPNPQAIQIGVFTGSGQSVSLNAADGCSTICLQFSTDGDANVCANATVYCETVSGPDTTWTFKKHWNWNSGLTRYFRALEPGATGKYKVAGHSNGYPFKFLARWLGSNTVQETPSSTITMPAHSVGTDAVPIADDGEFNEGITGGVSGFHDLGTTLDQYPRYLGDLGADFLDLVIPGQPDFARPWLYQGGDPLQGYAAETVLSIRADDLLDELGQPTNFLLVNVSIFQPSGPGLFGTLVAQRVGDEILVDDGIIDGQFLFPEPMQIQLQVVPASVASGMAPGVERRLRPMGQGAPQRGLAGAAMGAGTLVLDAIVLDHLTIGPAAGTVPGGPTPVALNLKAFPNPFQAAANIQFSLVAPGVVNLAIVDVRGRLVRTLEQGELLAGEHQYRWDGRSDTGRSVRAGMYFMVLRNAQTLETRKILRVQ